MYHKEKKIKSRKTNPLVSLSITSTLFVEKKTPSQESKQDSLDFHLEMVKKIDALFVENKQDPSSELLQTPPIIPLQPPSPIEPRTPLNKPLSHREITWEPTLESPQTIIQNIPEEFKTEISINPEFRFITSGEFKDIVSHTRPSTEERVEIINLSDLHDDTTTFQKNIDSTHIKNSNDEVQVFPFKNTMFNQERDNKKIEIIETQPRKQNISKNLMNASSAEQQQQKDNKVHLRFLDKKDATKDSTDKEQQNLQTEQPQHPTESEEQSTESKTKDVEEKELKEFEDESEELEEIEKKKKEFVRREQDVKESEKNIEKEQQNLQTEQPQHPEEYNEQSIESKTDAEEEKKFKELEDKLEKLEEIEQKKTEFEKKEQIFTEPEINTEKKPPQFTKSPHNLEKLQKEEKRLERLKQRQARIQEKRQKKEELRERKKQKKQQLLMEKETKKQKTKIKQKANDTILKDKVEHLNSHDINDEDIAKVLLITDKLLGELPDNILNQFLHSKEFELYEKVLNKYKIR